MKHLSAINRLEAQRTLSKPLAVDKIDQNVETARSVKPFYYIVVYLAKINLVTIVKFG